jgi:acetyl-CoA synthetase
MLSISHWLILPPVMDKELKRLEPPNPVGPMHPAFMLADSAGQIFTLPTAGFLVQAVSAYRHLLDGRGAGDVLWILSSRHHAALHSVVIGSLALGGQIGLMPFEAAHNPDKFREALELARPRVLLSDVETVVRLVNKSSKEERSPKTPGPALFIVEGEMLEPRIWEYVANDLFDGKTHMVQALARPEAGGFILGPHPAVTPIMRSSVATPAPGIDLTIVNNKGHECKPGHGGLLALKRACPSLSQELQALSPPIPIEVKARRDNAGYFWTMGEVEIRMPVDKGISIPEMEAVLASMEGVDQVAVVRFQNSGGGYETKAFIKPMGDVHISSEEIREKITERYGEQLVLDSVKIVSSLPYSHSGKLLRSVLRRICTKEPLDSDDLRLVTDPEVIDELAGGKENGEN